MHFLNILPVLVALLVVYQVDSFAVGNRWTHTVSTSRSRIFVNTEPPPMFFVEDMWNTPEDEDDDEDYLKSSNPKNQEWKMSGGDPNSDSKKEVCCI